MRTVRLDPTETDESSHEDYLCYAKAEQCSFPDTDHFLFATLETGLFEKDERWYSKRGASTAELLAFLSQALMHFSTESSQLPAPTAPGVLLGKDWDHLDFAYLSSSAYVRVYWYTTA